MIYKRQQFNENQGLVIGTISKQNEPASINGDIGISLSKNEAIILSGAPVCNTPE